MFDWVDYLNLAKDMAGVPCLPINQEAKLRCAVSRAYYAAFCTARRHLEKTYGRSIISPNVHKKVIDEYKHSPDKKRQKIGEYLNLLRLDRVKVDYDDQVSNLEGIGKKSLKRAEQIINLLKTP